ncbi:cell division protein DedD [Martelella alba]|uniref:Cell division protein DedD n=1 Tax=Martelella alba TaxID=2590451 RepID=A0ABY2SFQ4_9HYPH|nr:cell division protein DedD [Martelella alba]TKI03842.1 cell division protein DedD [Martelella alba]
MASKFQNRLVGTIIIVALGVIVLPGLLDGKKKHYQDEFAAIPLVPKPGDTDETEASPQASQSLPSQPPEGAGAAVRQASKASENDSRSAAAVPDTPLQPEISTPPAEKPAPAASGTREAPARSTESAPRTPPSKPAQPESRPTPPVKPEKKPAAPEPKPQTPSVAAQPAEQPPQGQAWVVQLGALRNAGKVDEIVAKLRLSGYRVYTVPSKPVAGQITRIFVGPDASRQKMQGALPDLNQLSGLNGQLKPYQVR